MFGPILFSYICREQSSVSNQLCDVERQLDQPAYLGNNW